MQGFSRADRFEVVRRLGEGGMGVVYEALDRERGERVALKTLRGQSADALVRFKREFRALQDLHHDNVVTLGELISEGDLWFFTMELVEGTDFLGYVRGTETILRCGDDQAALSTADGSIPVPPSSTRRQLPRGGALPFDEARLRAVLRQLVDAVCALHDVGLVHRDIKPSNIRVTKDGRLVLLDFGVVGEVDGDHAFTANRAIGTPAYMAPEQAAAEAPGPAVDWYAVGVLLYEALTSELPFTGATPLLLAQKQWFEPRAPSARVPHVPPDLDALSVSLLQVAPAARPTSRELALAYGSRHPSERPSRPHAPLFVGRADDLAILQLAYEDARRGMTISVLVDGESGVGKTCLTRHFIDHLSERVPGLLVLAGRCYERESVPYKAFDGVVDALARALARLPPDEAKALLPSRVAPLLQVFPVLRSVGALGPFAGEPARALDPLDLRKRAFAALREVVTRLTKRWPVVIVIDDVQWADDDSRKLLSEVLGPPDPPCLLVLATRRTLSAEAADAPPSARDFATSLPGDVRTVKLTRLSSAEARELAERLSAQSGRSEPIDAASIAREADGHPLFIDVLVRHDAVPRGGRAGVRLEEALQSLVARLDELARSVVELLAVAGTPLAQEILARAVSLDGAAVTKCIALLRAAHLVLTTRTGTLEHVDLFHDRIRAAVLAPMDPDARVALHRQLAVALEATEGADAEMLATHWRGAGDLARAARHTVMAADRAARALAFERAARLYQVALTLDEPSAEQRRELHAKLGDALANAGRGAPAAKAFLAAAEGAPAADALERQRRAAAQLMRAGHIDEGIAVIRTVLASIGGRLPETYRSALFLFLLRRFVLFLRGLDFRERDPAQIAPGKLVEIDICWSVTHSLGMSDYARSAPFQALHLLLALRAGEPSRVSRALATEVMTVGRLGGKTWHRAEALMARAMELAERIEQPRTVGWTLFACGYSCYFAGRFRRALELIERSHLILRDCAGTAYEVATVQRTWLMCLAHLGDLKELARLRPIYLREAFDRGDLYGVVNMRLGYSNIASLVEDDADQARAEIADSLRLWSKAHFHLEHYFALIARANADLYSGDAASALAMMNQQWSALRRSLLLSVQSVRMLAHWGRGRCALAVAAAGAGDRAAVLATAEKDTRAVARERWGWSVPIAALMEAGLAMVRARDEGRARALLQRSVAGFDEADMALHAAAARRCLGTLQGGDEGRALVSAADAWMASQGVVNSERMTRMIAPGICGSASTRVS